MSNRQTATLFIVPFLSNEAQKAISGIQTVRSHDFGYDVSSPCRSQSRNALFMGTNSSQQTEI